ncbi:protein C3orf33 homolog isoform X1 [Vidua chalybeata]|uniref:protein C3orf33 homolog isoform X1 n=1 Tax=Vidua chalybeata TaxID=81927 RepID=UPI0023A8881D|nr:protein C3orf33 homolog isoform X1 [Vidua chalybeata]
MGGILGIVPWQGGQAWHRVPREAVAAPVPWQCPCRSCSGPVSLPAVAAPGAVRFPALWQGWHRALFVSRFHGTAAPGAVRFPVPWNGSTGRCSFPGSRGGARDAAMPERGGGGSERAALALARLSEWADAHLGLLRGLIAGAAVAGVLLLARSLRVTTKFTNPLDIPVEFVEKNVKLRGKLHHITEKGLEVEHIPISIPFISAIQRKWQPEGLLLIRLAGVELAAGGTAWLQRELLPKQPLWFQLLGRDSSALECLVLVHKGGFFSMCLNEELLSQGLARAARIEGLPHHSRLYWKLHKRLLRAELKAVKKNKGIWKEQSYSERVQERISSNKFLQRLKQFVSWVRSSTER